MKNEQVLMSTCEPPSMGDPVGGPLAELCTFKRAMWRARYEDVWLSMAALWSDDGRPRDPNGAAYSSTTRAVGVKESIRNYALLDARLRTSFLRRGVDGLRSRFAVLFYVVLL